MKAVEINVFNESASNKFLYCFCGRSTYSFWCNCLVTCNKIWRLHVMESLLYSKLFDNRCNHLLGPSFLLFFLNLNLKLHCLFPCFRRFSPDTSPQAAEKAQSPHGQDVTRDTGGQNTHIRLFGALRSPAPSTPLPPTRPSPTATVAVQGQLTVLQAPTAAARGFHRGRVDDGWWCISPGYQLGQFPWQPTGNAIQKAD